MAKAKSFARKLYVIEHFNEKGKWELTRFGDWYRELRPTMLNELAKARQQFPDEKYKLTTYVPREPTSRKR